MPLNKYRVLSKIAETGKMHEAAQELIYSKQNLSRITKTMEEEYGFPLFVRTRDGVQLTENAKRMLPAVNKIIEAENELIEIINQIQEEGGLVKQVRIGACGSTVLGLVQEAIKTMEIEHEELSVDVRYFVDGKFFIEGLTTGAVDFCMIVDGYQEDFDFEPVLKERFYAVLPKKHELAKKTELSYKDLFDYTIVATPDCPFLEDVTRNSKNKPLIVDDEIIGLPIVDRKEAVGIFAGVSQYDFGPRVIAVPIRENQYRTIGIASCKGRELSYAAREFKSVIIRTAESFNK